MQNGIELHCLPNVQFCASPPLSRKGAYVCDLDLHYNETSDLKDSLPTWLGFGGHACIDQIHFLPGSRTKNQQSSLAAAEGAKTNALYAPRKAISPLFSVLRRPRQCTMTRRQAVVVMQRLSYPTEIVISNKVTRNRIVLSFKNSPRKPLGRRPYDDGLTRHLKRSTSILFALRKPHYFSV